MAVKPSYKELEKKFKRLEEQCAKLCWRKEEKNCDESIFRFLLDSLPVLIAYVDSSERYCFVNKTYEKKWGLCRHDILGKTIKELLGRERYIRISQYVRKALAGEQVSFDGCIDWHKSGPRHFSATYVPDIKEDGVVAGFYGLVIDTTGRKEAEERYRLAVKGAKAGLWDVVFSPYSCYLSPRWRRILGYADDEVLDPHEVFDNNMHPDDYPLFRKKMDDLMEHDQPLSMELRVKNKQEEYRWLLASAASQRDNDGAVVRLAGSIIDITDKKNAEWELCSHQQQLKVQTEKRQDADTAFKVLLRNRDEEKNDIKRNISASIDKLIIPYFEKLKSTLDSSRQRHLVKIIIKEFDLITSQFGIFLSEKAVLTPRELEIATLIRHGLSSKEIAASLTVSLNSIAFHRKNIRKKLGIHRKNINLRSHLLSLSAPANR